MSYTKEQMINLFNLISYSNKYEIDIQFWPEQTAVFISKDDVELNSFGGDFDFAITSSLLYLQKINRNRI